MDTQQNIKLVNRFFDEVLMKGNLELIDQLFASDVQLHDPAAPNFKGGLAAFREKEVMYKKAFPNRNIKINDIHVLDENRVVVQWTCQGTHKGELQDIPATNKNFKITGISIYTIKNNKISEINQNWDRLGLLEQLGAIEQHAMALHR